MSRQRTTTKQICHIPDNLTMPLLHVIYLVIVNKQTESNIIKMTTDPSTQCIDG